jgi:hypothetical protein
VPCTRAATRPGDGSHTCRTRPSCGGRWHKGRRHGRVGVGKRAGGRAGEHGAPPPRGGRCEEGGRFAPPARLRGMHASHCGARTAPCVHEGGSPYTVGRGLQKSVQVGRGRRVSGGARRVPGVLMWPPVVRLRLGPPRLPRRSGLAASDAAAKVAAARAGAGASRAARGGAGESAGPGPSAIIYTPRHMRRPRGCWERLSCHEAGVRTFLGPRGLPAGAEPTARRGHLCQNTRALPL